MKQLPKQERERERERESTLNEWKRGREKRERERGWTRAEGVGVEGAMVDVVLSRRIVQALVAKGSIEAGGSETGRGAWLRVTLEPGEQEQNSAT